MTLKRIKVLIRRLQKRSKWSGEQSNHKSKQELAETRDKEIQEHPPAPLAKEQRSLLDDESKRQLDEFLNCLHLR
ncbi:MAG: hypothetical protein GF401_16285 [Chitinivibrionales bacterium]|nr:hypothetical protein [Chitinivibrionales bacterium]